MLCTLVKQYNFNANCLPQESKLPMWQTLLYETEMNCKHQLDSTLRNLRVAEYLKKKDTELKQQNKTFINCEEVP